MLIPEDSQKKTESSDIANLELQKQLLKRFGERVQSIRVKARLSQEQLSERVQLHRSYISDIERGMGNVSLSVLFRLAAALDISLTALLEGTDPRLDSCGSRILVADDCNAFDLARLLKGHDVVVCNNFADVLAEVSRTRFDLMIGCVMFEKNRMFDLLRSIRASEAHKSTPFLCISPTPLTSPLMKEALDIALLALGATVLIDADRFSKGDGSEALRSEIESYLTARRK